MHQAILLILYTFNDQRLLADPLSKKIKRRIVCIRNQKSFESYGMGYTTRSQMKKAVKITIRPDLACCLTENNIIES